MGKLIDRQYPSDPDALVPEAVGSMRHLAEIAGRHPSLATSPLVALGQYVAACEILADYGFVTWTNVGLAMELAAALVQVSIQVLRARQAEEMGRDEAEGVIRQSTSQLLANSEFEGGFDGHAVVGILGEGVPWQAMTISLDDRLAYQIELKVDGATTGWIASCDGMSDAEVEWLLGSGKEHGKAKHVPVSLSEAVELAHRFRDAVFVTMGVKRE